MAVDHLGQGVAIAVAIAAYERDEVGFGQTITGQVTNAPVATVSQSIIVAGLRALIACSRASSMKPAAALVVTF